MKLEQIIATPHPDGNQIDLSWVNPDPVTLPGVRLVRRAGTHPTRPDDGVVVADLVADGSDPAVTLDEGGLAHYQVADKGLKGQTIYYYSLFPYDGEPPVYDVERANRTAALATATYDVAGQMFTLLPAIYHRYDADGEAVAGQGPLRRFLNLPGGQLDLLQSFARSLLDLYDLDRGDGRLLHLLAEWIGWKTDYRLEVDAQRNEIRNAPSIYRRVGMIPVVGATVQRISGWESRSKEFVHNVFRSNQPERLNLWARRMAADGSLVTADTFLSSDAAYEGRPTVAQDDLGVRWVFYHTLRRGRLCLWYKTSPTSSIGLDTRPHLDTPDVAALQQALAEIDIEIAADATVTAVGSRWRIDDATNAQTYVVEEGEEALTVYHTSADPMALAPSRPLFVNKDTTHEKYPAAALQGDTLWVFWSVYDEAADRWDIRYTTRRDGTWAEGYQVFAQGADPQPERKAPAVLVDQDGSPGFLWLFWRERVGTRWLLRYNRYDSAGLASDPPDPAAWQLDPPATFPFDGMDDPRVEDDVFVRFHPTAPNQPIWVFWARKEATIADPAQTRWTVAARFKESTDPAVSDWSGVELMTKDDEDAHDREPAAHVDDDGNLAVYWSANREGSWSIWRATLRLDSAPPVWENFTELTAPPFSQRNPLPLPLPGGIVLLYRSNESLVYHSDVYQATETVDNRYAGATTVHIRNTAKRDLREAFEDFETYTHDTGPNGQRQDDDWYARDTIGVYLVPDTLDAEAVVRSVERLKKVLPEFMPATDRAVFVTQSDLHTDYVYTYDRPGAAEPRFIGEQFSDTLTAPLNAEALGPDEDFIDELL